MPQNIETASVAALMQRVIGEIVINKFREKLTQPPVVQAKPIVAVDGQFKMSGFEKFAIRSYVGLVYFYADERDKVKNKAAAILAVYLKESALLKHLLSTGKIKPGGLEEPIVEKACAEISQDFANTLRPGLGELGVNAQEISAAVVFKDYIPGGVSVPKGLKQFYEASIELWDIDAMIVDLILAT